MSGEYSFIISNMVWSYSRLTCFEQCPYKFFLTYLTPGTKRPQFFSDFGSFMHSILEKFYKGELKAEELPAYYLSHYDEQVIGRAPSAKIAGNYYMQGLDYLTHVNPLNVEVLGVEHQVEFNIDGKQFQGIIDLKAKNRHDGSLMIIDHKSRALKPRSKRKKPTQSDETLDGYLRQLYLYSQPVLDESGHYPKSLVFNCFRNGNVIIEPFEIEKFNEAKQWASELADKIIDNDDWRPNEDFYFCHYLCDKNHECEYFQDRRYDGE